MERDAGDWQQERPDGSEGRPARIPETTWRRIEGLLSAKTPDAALREALDETVRCYAIAPARKGLLPWSAAEVRACAGRIAEAATGAAMLRWQVAIPGTKETLLQRYLVRWLLWHDPTTAVVPFPPIIGAELDLLGERAARLAKTYSDHGGANRNYAFIELVWQFIRIIEARCGAGAARLGRSDHHDAGSGPLSEVVWELRPWLPGLARKNARRLYEMLFDAQAIAREW
jgi:hypothetical protein